MLSPIRLSARAGLLAILVTTLVVAGCAQKAVDQSANLAPGAGATGGPVVPGTQRDFSVNVGDIVYFNTDSSDLTPEARQTLQKQAQWLNQYPQFTITIEGHADERGTREYNIALGARRATAVRNFSEPHGREQVAHPDDLVRQGTPRRGLRRHLVLVSEPSRTDSSEQSRRGLSGLRRSLRHRGPRWPPSNGLAWQV